MGSSPQRTCLGCRGVFDKGLLVRVAARDGVLRVDPGSVSGGRGAYVCPAEECVKDAFRKKEVFSRALKQKTELPNLDEFLIEIRMAKKPKGSK